MACICADNALEKKLKKWDLRNFHRRLEKMLNDPLANALSAMKNAEIKGKGSCIIQPSSKLIGGVLMFLIYMEIGQIKHINSLPLIN